MKTKRTSKILHFRTEAKQVTGKKTLEAFGLRAEFFANQDADTPTYHYVVMRKDSVEILGWGQERSEEAADRAARDCMEALRRRTSAAG